MSLITKQENIKKQKRKLEAKEEEAMAKILRLRSQKRLLLEREEQIIDRGLRALDCEESAFSTISSATVVVEDPGIPSPGNLFWDLFEPEGTLLGEPSYSIGFLLVPMCYPFLYNLFIVLYKVSNYFEQTS